MSLDNRNFFINQENYDSACRPRYEIRHGSHEDEIQLAKVRYFLLEAQIPIFGIFFQRLSRNFSTMFENDKVV